MGASGSPRAARFSVSPKVRLSPRLLARFPCLAESWRGFLNVPYSADIGAAPPREGFRDFVLRTGFDAGYAFQKPWFRGASVSALGRGFRDGPDLVIDGEQAASGYQTFGDGVGRGRSRSSVSGRPRATLLDPTEAGPVYHDRRPTYPLSGTSSAADGEGAGPARRRFRGSGPPGSAFRADFLRACLVRFTLPSLDA